jgi:AraC-like DNA-binding protein
MAGRSQRLGASVALILALFGYIIVLPAALAPEEYRGWVPSYLFYVSLDLYVFVRILLILRAVWRTRIGLDLLLFALVFAGILVSDVIDGFWNLELIHVPSTDWRAPLFYLPLLPLLLLTSPIWRLHWQRLPFLPERRPIPDLERIVYWLLPLALHLVGYGFGWLDPGLRTWRDSYLLLWLGVVLGFELHRRYRVADFDEAGEPAPVAEALTPAVSAESGRPPPTEPDPLLARLDAYLEAHLSEHALSLEQIGRKLALSPRQIQRRLKAATGLSPSQYLLEKRLQYAARLLKEGHKGGYVAEASGFSQQSHFTRRFKARYGVTPGQYARQP